MVLEHYQVQYVLNTPPVPNLETGCLDILARSGSAVHGDRDAYELLPLPSTIYSLFPDLH